MTSYKATDQKQVMKRPNLSGLAEAMLLALLPAEAGTFTQTDYDEAGEFIAARLKPHSDQHAAYVLVMAAKIVKHTLSELPEKQRAPLRKAQDKTKNVEQWWNSQLRGTATLKHVTSSMSPDERNRRIALDHKLSAELMIILEAIYVFQAANFTATDDGGHQNLHILKVAEEYEGDHVNAMEFICQTMTGFKLWLSHHLPLPWEGDATELKKDNYVGRMNAVSEWLLNAHKKSPLSVQYAPLRITDGSICQTLEKKLNELSLETRGSVMYIAWMICDALNIKDAGIPTNAEPVFPDPDTLIRLSGKTPQRIRTAASRFRTDVLQMKFTRPKKKEDTEAAV